MVYSDAWGKLIHEKNQKSKISWHCPFKYYILEAGGHWFMKKNWSRKSRVRLPLKGQCHEIFCVWFFSWISFPQASDYNIRAFATGIVDTGGKFATGQWHQWQIMGTISGCRHLKVNLKAKFYIYVKSSTQRCRNKIIDLFLNGGFFHFPPVSLTPVVHLELRISPRIFENIRNGPNGIIRGLGETDSRTKPEAKNLVTLSL